MSLSRESFRAIVDSKISKYDLEIQHKIWEDIEFVKDISGSITLELQTVALIILRVIENNKQKDEQ